MKSAAVLAISSLALLLSACATPYQQIGTSIAGGYSANRLSAETFEVRFAGNAFTDPQQAYDFALLRAAETALEHNFLYFELLGHRDESSAESVSMLPTSYTTGTVNTYGGRSTYNEITTTYPMDVPVMKPVVALRILALESSTPRDRHAGKIYDAEGVRRELRQKHGLTYP